MRVLVPVDGSDCSDRALEFAIGFVRRHDGEIRVVHFTGHAGESTAAILERVEGILEEAGLSDEPEVVTDMRMSRPKYADRIGKDVPRIAEDGSYDHTAMGHHGSGAVERLLLGSAAETVVRAAAVPTTVIP